MNMPPSQPEPFSWPVVHPQPSSSRAAPAVSPPLDSSPSESSPVTLVGSVVGSVGSTAVVLSSPPELLSAESSVVLLVAGPVSPPPVVVVPAPEVRDGPVLVSPPVSGPVLLSTGSGSGSPVVGSGLKEQSLNPQHGSKLICSMMTPSASSSSVWLPAVK